MRYGEWRKLRNKTFLVLFDKYNENNEVDDKMGGVCSMNGEKVNECRLLVGKPEGNRPLGRPRSMWVYSIKMDLGERVCCGEDWIGLAQDKDKWRIVFDGVMNLRVP
jgi:hypothetical protein